MPKIRVIKQGTLEVVGAAELEELRYSNAYAFKIEKEGEVPLIVAFANVPYWIDDENRPLSEVDRGSSEIPCTRLEYFLVVEETWIGKLPGWVRLPPKRIMVMGDNINC